MRHFYLLMCSEKGGYVSHSAHATREAAQSWLDCLEHNGDKHCAICIVSEDEVSSLFSLTGVLASTAK